MNDLTNERKWISKKEGFLKMVDIETEFLKMLDIETEFLKDW